MRDIDRPDRKDRQIKKAQRAQARAMKEQQRLQQAGLVDASAVVVPPPAMDVRAAGVPVDHHKVDASSKDNKEPVQGTYEAI